MASPLRSPAEKACEGGRTLECGDMRECVACGTKVIWDLIDHEVFGFRPENCILKRCGYCFGPLDANGRCCDECEDRQSDHAEWIGTGGF